MFKNRGNCRDEKKIPRDDRKKKKKHILHRLLVHFGLRSYYSLNGPQCHSYLFKLVNCLRINCNFDYEIVRNKWFELNAFSAVDTRGLSTSDSVRDSGRNPVHKCEAVGRLLRNRRELKPFVNPFVPTVPTFAVRETASLNSFQIEFSIPFKLKGIENISL